eukprot:gene9717-11932_t
MDQTTFNYDYTYFPIPNTYSSPGDLNKKSNNKNKNVKLFTPITIKDMTLKNRIVVPPMCQYSSKDGFMNDFHLAHLGSFAMGGASLIIFEATAVVPEGRITYGDAGIWKDEHVPQLKRIVDFVHNFGAKAGIQIAHAGRKASTNIPFIPEPAVIPIDGVHGWQVRGPSPIQWDSNHQIPKEYTTEELKDVVKSFKDAARRVREAGFDFLEIHGAHGYLIDSFLSPTSNKRTDEYGGGLENRTRLLIEIVKAIREEWPESKPLAVRISAVEWVSNGTKIEDTIQRAKILNELGVDLLDVSSGGNSSTQKIPTGPLYQVPFSDRIRKEVVGPMRTSAVGLIKTPKEAESVLQDDKADLVMIGRSFLKNSNWAIDAARELNVDIEVPLQYHTIKHF